MQETASSLLRALADDDSLVSGLRVDEDTRRALFSAMARLRAFDDECVALQREGTLPSFFSARLQEAVICGATQALTHADAIFPTPREYGVCLQRGVSPEELASQLLGRGPGKGRQAPGYVSFRGAKVASVSGIIGAHLPHAVGYAWAARRSKSKEASESVVVAFFGDGATSAGEFHNALNFAGVMKAPVLFVCRNNGMAISTPVAKQTASETLAEKAHAYGIPGLEVDGSDVVAVYRAVRTWVDGARRGGGPMLIEARTDLLPDRDPIARLMRHLMKDNLISEDAVAAIDEEARAEALSAITAAKSRPGPARDSLFDDVFAVVPPHLVSQRDHA
jgi:TPP-dependent pyruvate/acetoin dehydrogenase alpha subunit